MIRYYCEQIKFSLEGKRKNSAWLKSVVESEGKKLGQVSIIFTSDENLLEINKKFLSHDYFTDIITFDYCEGGVVSGDLFISIDSVRQNAQTYGSSFEEELYRVMVHGILHLIGYDDLSEEQKLVMRAKENFYLSLKNSHYA